MNNKVLKVMFDEHELFEYESVAVICSFSRCKMCKFLKHWAVLYNGVT